MSNKETFDKKKIKITSEQLLFLNNQLASMVRLDLSIPQGLQSLSEEIQDPKFRYMIREVEKDLSQGIPLMEALKKFPQSFPPLYVEILKAGESTGNLATVLNQLSQYSETMYKIKNKIRDALSYPLLIGCISLGLFFYMLIFAVPQFQKLLMSVKGKTLPLLTRTIFFLSEVVLTPSLAIPLGVGLFIVLVFLILKLQKAGADFAQGLFYIPIFGSLFRKASLLKVCRSMSDLLKNGVSMVETLALTSNIAGKNKIRLALMEMKEAVENGERMSAKLQDSDVFPETMVWKLQMAEERGILEEALEELANQYEDELDAAASRITRIVEPLMLVVIAFMVGVLVLALYLPLFQAYGR